MEKSRLTPGDTFVTEIGEAYTYLGFYEGKPHSMYSVPSYGYLYIFVDCIKYRPIIGDEQIVRNIQIRVRHKFDGHASYTKNPKHFVEKIMHTDIEQLQLQMVYGLVRVGDRKPRGYKETFY